MVVGTSNHVHPRTILSKLVGANMGTAKRATVTVVECHPDIGLREPSPSAEYFIDALVRIVEDIASKQRQWKSVVTISISITGDGFNPGLERAMGK